MGLPPETTFQVQAIGELATPRPWLIPSTRILIVPFAQRPELLAQVARVRAANASIKQARSTYFPTLGFSGDGGLARAYGQQDLFPGHYAQGETLERWPAAQVDAL